MATRSEIESDEGAADAQLMARVCWNYFKEGLTQETIAQQLGFTRKRVNRILNDARMNGFVQIAINSPYGACMELEAGLRQKYELRHAIVVPVASEETDVRTLVGAAAGKYISDNLRPGATLGISWGGTINSAAQNIVRRQATENKVVLMCGGLSKSTQINPFDNASLFSRALDATCYYMTAPLIAASESLREALVASEPIRSVLNMVKEIDMALLSAIDLSEQSKALEYDVISQEACDSLRAAGAVGDVCGHYLDASGATVAHPLVRCIVHPQLDRLRAIPELVLAAGGVHKVPIIQGAIRAGLCHVLITDEKAAAALLQS
ncbi:sugar-binding transcriptional regulator [Burkholderia contaminans]|uniref:Sugar-binding transcriptional regulator n=1 Tax=Burkholderia contaminans TaxID=488447 RepID=A0A3N8Q6S4_9BURK|nr:sugar-binding domain-containing protein [Burkholderia contaminans]RQT14926.1 sugar-binding transcriptional regulator [Burkholderia contaminans]